MQISKIYKLDMSSKLNDPWYTYAVGGQGALQGLSEGHQYVIALTVAVEPSEPDYKPRYVFINITTGRIVTGTHPLERFVAI